MENTELKILTDKLNKFVDETRKNFGAVNDSLNTFDERQEDVFRKLGGLENEVHLLQGNIETQTKVAKKATKDLQEDIAGSTKVVIKEVDKTKLRWWQKWIKKIKGGDTK